MQKSTSIVVRRSNDDKIVAQIVNGTYIKLVQGSRHRIKYLDGWALDDPSYHGHRHLFDTIRIEDQEDGSVYVIDASKFDEKAIPIEFGNHGPQLALPRRYWNSEDGTGKSASVHQSPPNPRPLQAALWE